MPLRGMAICDPAVAERSQVLDKLREDLEENPFSSSSESLLKASISPRMAVIRRLDLALLRHAVRPPPARSSSACSRAMRV
jgi:hypothetical protein